jgi:hypothetical protein
MLKVGYDSQFESGQAPCYILLGLISLIIKNNSMKYSYITGKQAQKYIHLSWWNSESVLVVEGAWDICIYKIPTHRL